MNILSREIHKPMRKIYQTRRVLLNHIDEVWGVDLVELQDWSDKNDGYRYILNVIDTFSKSNGQIVIFF